MLLPLRILTRATTLAGVDRTLKAVDRPLQLQVLLATLMYVATKMKTVPGSLSENAQVEVAAGCSAYHLSIQDESISRPAGCSAYPTNPVEQPCSEEKFETGEGLQPRGRYGIISLFDGVFSVVPLLKKNWLCSCYSTVVVVLLRMTTGYGHWFTMNLDIGPMKNGAILLKVVRHCT